MLRTRTWPVVLASSHVLRLRNLSLVGSPFGGRVFRLKDFSEAPTEFGGRVTFVDDTPDSLGWKFIMLHLFAPPSHPFFLIDAVLP